MVGRETEMGFLVRKMPFLTWVFAFLGDHLGDHLGDGATCKVQSTALKILSCKDIPGLGAHAATATQPHLITVT